MLKLYLSYIIKKLCRYLISNATEPTMKKQNLAQLRLNSQQIEHQEFKTPIELVEWMGAIQAQSYEMAKWAIGCRLPGATLKMVEDAIKNGEIIRTHVLRPTWHFVAAKNLRWMLALTAPRIKMALQSRLKQLGITKPKIVKSNAVIEEALGQENYLTRREIGEVIEQAGFKNDDNQVSHLLMQAEMDSVICSGPTKGTTHTYALLDERVPKTETLSKEASLEKLGQIYFRSHGPAALEDFVWWSGLKKTDARKAIALIEDKLQSIEVDSCTYYLQERPAKSLETLRVSTQLLPAYDEYLISYANRSASITDNNHAQAISRNGIFYPIMVLNGQVAGLWKRTHRKQWIEIELKPFAKLSTEAAEAFENEAQSYAGFFDKTASIHYR